MKTLLIITTILISVWLCAGSTHNSLRQRRSISESTRFHNEYDSADLRGHRNVATSPRDCVPGTRWKNDCNSCWCSDTGISACTLMGCLHFDDNSNALTNSHRRQPIFGHTVSRNSIQDHGEKHSRVRRSEDNNVGPTISSRRKQSSSGTTRTIFLNSPPENEKKCNHGTTWMNRCNRCRCFGGRAACTRMMCPDSLHKEGNI